MTSSRQLSADRASPFEELARNSSASLLTFTQLVMVELYASTALTSIFVRASDDRALRTTVLQRLSKALFRLKDGFSVVAPKNVIVPSSMWGRNVSCWVLLNLWTSSTKRTVLRLKDLFSFLALPQHPSRRKLRKCRQRAGRNGYFH